VKKAALILLITASAVKAQTFTFPLDATPQRAYYLAEHFMAANATQTLLVNEDTALQVFNLQGEKLASINGKESKFRIANFAALAQDNIAYAVCFFDQASKGKGSPRWETWLYDQSGSKLGQIVDSSNQEDPENFYIRELITAGGQLFANSGQLPTEDETNPPLLQKVQLMPIESNQYELQPLGKPFSAQLAETASFKAQFKRRWVLPGLDPEKILVLDQLQPRIWPFSANQFDPDSFDRLDNPEPLKFENRIFPFEYFNPHKYREETRKKAQGSLSPTQAAWFEWLYSFSQNTGFWQFGEGYLLAYTVPLPELQKDQLISQEVKPREVWRQFGLMLQRLDENFVRQGAPKAYIGRHCMGVIDDIVYLVKPGQQASAFGEKAPKHEVEIVLLSDFDY